MATNEDTIKALERLSKQLTNLGVKSEDLKTLNLHIREQKKQLGWVFRRGKWIYEPSKKKKRS